MYYLEHVVCAKFFKFAITLKYIYRKSVYDIKTNEKINYYIPSNISKCALCETPVVFFPDIQV